MTLDAVHGARRAEAEIVWVGLLLASLLRSRAPLQRRNAPEALF